jgi:PAT family acetyl-CoA transporter-like MFS transporter 1
MSEGAKASSAQPTTSSLRQRGVEGGKAEPKGDTMKGPSIAQLQSRMEQGAVTKGTDNPNPSGEVSVWEERMSMGLLLLLYTLQGIPMGLCGSIPLILKERGATYEGLSLFSLVSLPFSLKLLWAPFVDSCYLKSLGRRKTWLVPVQLLTGLVMIVGAPTVGTWLGGDVTETHTTKPHIEYLTAFFFGLYFLMATQDIAVDGWALTMLSRENVGYASTCNSIGQSFGYFLANQGFTALSDATWCHRHLGFPTGTILLTLENFMSASGWVFIVLTFLVWVFKVEKPIDPEDEPEGLVETYAHVVSMFRLKAIQQIFFILVTCKIPFAPADSVSGFKLQEYGMPKADIATISPVLLVIGLFLPALVAPVVTTRPLEVFMWGMPMKLATSALGWVVVQSTKSAYAGGAEPGMLYFSSLLGVMILHEVAGTLIFISLMTFFNKVSDPNIGGTYMTFLNTISNLGSKWPNSVALWFQPKLTVASCELTLEGVVSVLGVSCAADGGSACVTAGGSCHTYLDGFTVQTVVCILFGVLWIVSLKDMVLRVQSLPFRDWMVTKASISSSTRGSSSLSD